jgi:predicted acylesterase/phospholipase RssA
MAGPVKALVFIASGAGGFLQLGVLHTLRKEGLLPGSIRKLVGTSAGSVVAFIAALDICPKDIMKSIISHEDSHPLLFSIRISKLFEEFGLDDGSRLFDFVFWLVDRVKPGCNQLTFGELLRTTGRELHIPTTCVTT